MPMTQLHGRTASRRPDRYFSVLPFQVDGVYFRRASTDGIKFYFLFTLISGRYSMAIDRVGEGQSHIRSSSNRSSLFA